MADCPYCLETENHYIDNILNQDNRVEFEVVACEEPYLMVRYFNNRWYANWRVGMRIKYCPMCGRRLGGGKTDEKPV